MHSVLTKALSVDQVLPKGKWKNIPFVERRTTKPTTVYVYPFNYAYDYVVHDFAMIMSSLTHCGLVTPYGGRDLG